jgi:hypothetical protein
MSLQPYVELPCENVAVISAGIYKFLQEHTNLLNATEYGWHFIDCNRLLASVPELLEYFKQLKLVPRHAAVTIITSNDHLDKHIDEPPVIAKINIPVLNTQGWANRWYENDQLVAELLDMQMPVVFNSQIVHSVEKTTAVEVPRIVASFTFHNEPLDMLI